MRLNSKANNYPELKSKESIQRRVDELKSKLDNRKYKNNVEMRRILAEIARLSKKREALRART